MLYGGRLNPTAKGRVAPAARLRGQTDFCPRRRATSRRLP